MTSTQPHTSMYKLSQQTKDVGKNICYIYTRVITAPKGKGLCACSGACVNSAKSRMVKELYGYTDASYDAHMSVGAKRTLLMMLTSNGLFSPVGVACLGLVARCRNSLTEFDSRDSRPREATRSSRRITPVCVSYLLKEKLAILSPLCFSTAA